MRTLLIEDDEAFRRTLARHLRRGSVEVTEAGNVADATGLLETADFDVVLVDVNLPDGLGLDLLSASSHNPSAAFVVMTASDLTDHAVSALRHGARDFLAKPFSMKALDDALHRIEQRRTITDRPPAPLEATDTWRRQHLPEAYGSDPQYLRALDIVRRVADTDCSVLITGETGTGKELVARAVHRASPRRDQSFVAVNCAAIPENLIESEFFGHAKGAFTGASAAHRGRFAQADGGTLFLDEIGEMPAAMQAKLLRVLQEGEVTPVGEQCSQQVDVRVVSATHRDVDELASQGGFREDLLYRLDVVRIELPPLRQRTSDIPGLVARFVAQIAERRGVPVSAVDDEAMGVLVAYRWPGNVRQLKHALERMVLLAAGPTLTLEDVPPTMKGISRGRRRSAPRLPAGGLDLRDAVEEYENALILQALERTGWNKNQAAAMLKMNRTTLVEKLKKRGMSKDG